MITGLGHVAINTRDPVALGAFYRDVLGLRITHEIGADAWNGPAMQLSSRPAQEHHELAIFPRADMRHVAFTVASLGDLRAMHHGIQERGLPILMAVDSGVSLAFFFDDPEGNYIEIYWPTGVLEHRLISQPIDLTAPPETLLREVETWRDEVSGSETHGGAPLGHFSTTN
jgi:catechol-2,3-dioxygenase